VEIMGGKKFIALEHPSELKARDAIDPEVCGAPWRSPFSGNWRYYP
jgi:hypothetical protein